MARQVAIAEATYAPGTYGPFSVDSFTGANTEFLELVFTVVGWPTATPLLEVFMRWGADPETRFVVPWVSGKLDKLGAPITEARFRIGVPRIATGKKPVTDGAIRAIVHATMTTAISIEAV